MRGYLILLSIFTGVLTPLSQAPYGLSFLAFFAFTPLFITLRHISTYKEALFYGSISGVTANLFAYRWVLNTLGIFFGLTIEKRLALYALYCFLGQAQYLIFLSLGIFLKKRYPNHSKYESLLLCVSSSLSLKLFGDSIGYAFISVHLLKPIYSTFGVKLLELICALSSSLIAYLVANKSDSQIKHSLVYLSSLSVIVGFGLFGSPDNPTQDTSHLQGSKFKIAVIQPNISMSRKRENAFLGVKSVVSEIIELSKKAMKENPGTNLIIWPEYAVPFDWGAKNEISVTFERVINDFVLEHNTHLLFSVREKTPDGQYFNSALLLSPQKTHIYTQRYKKTILALFSEYNPLSNNNTLSTGDGPGLLTIPHNGKTIRISPMICYEGLSEDYAHSLGALPHDLTVILTSEQWLNDIGAQKTFLDVNRSRAISTRAPLVKVSNSGISAFIDQGGRVLNQTPVNVPTYLVWEF